MGRNEQKPALTLVGQAQEYFRELITAALGHQHVKAKPETEFYLVNLLNQFMTTDHLYTRDSSGNICDEPLALLLKEALEQPQPQIQGAMLRRVGDISLYTAGFFQESLSRKQIDLGYYVGMGGAAYQQAALRPAQEVFKACCRELAEKFSRFVEVLAEVSEKTGQKSEKDLLRAYDNWMQTRSARAARTLREAGILPNQTIRKKLQ